MPENPNNDNLTSPFQLFTAFGEKDRDKFFGRDDEIAILNQLIQESNLSLIYGESGTGKTSLVQCGLLSETRHFNWSTITIRRLEEINGSFRQLMLNALYDARRTAAENERIAERQEAEGPNGPDVRTAIAEMSRESVDPAVRGKKIDELVKELENTRTVELVKMVFLINFQPILLIFDQFEELYVLGTGGERTRFYMDIKALLKIGIPCKIIIIIREDYFAQLNDFERYLPNLFKKQLRVEVVDKTKCRDVIVSSCRRFKIDLSPLRRDDTVKENGEAEEDVPDKIIKVVTESDKKIHLPYLQIFLDILWKKAFVRDSMHIKFDPELVSEVGSLGNVLRVFLEEKAANLEGVSKLDIWKLLKLFVPDKGSIRKRVLMTDYTAIPLANLLRIFEYLENNKVLSECKEGLYELAHESLVPIIQNFNISEVRQRLAVPTLLGPPYKGLEAYGQKDNDRFFGRKEVIAAIYEKITSRTLVVVVGNSGVGKSSLIKAGIFPLMEKDGYQIVDSIGKEALRGQTITRNLRAVQRRLAPGKKYVLLIDQYEELITRVTDKNSRQSVIEGLYTLIAFQSGERATYELKILITVRADFEPQFSIMTPLNKAWKEGKFIVPPFTRGEICQIIEEPAYQAGLEFSPPSLIDKIADEVYSSQATGLLPLMSFTLSEMYKEYVRSKRSDGLLMEKDYNDLGGVIGGLQTRGDKMYRRYKASYPKDYTKYQQVMKHIMLRMVYMAAGELAGQRVLRSDLEYSSKETNLIVAEVLNDLAESHLIITKQDRERRVYYEPAHDVLIRSWGQIWEWIGNLKKDSFLLRDLLNQALSDYESNGKNRSLLWYSNPRLSDLEEILKGNDCWLNRREEEFVRMSISARDAKAEAERRAIEKKNARTRNWVIALIAFIFVGLVTVVYIMRWMSAKTNIANANLAIANADTITDRRFALDMLIDANELFRRSNPSERLIKGGLNTSNMEIGRTFNGSDLNATVISKDSFDIAGYNLFDRDSRILVQYTSGMGSLPRSQTVLYNSNGKALRSWKHPVLKVEHSNLFAVVDTFNWKIFLYSDSIQRSVINLGGRIPETISHIYNYKDKFLVFGNAQLLLLCDTVRNKIIQNLSATDAFAYILYAEFLNNGAIAVVETMQKQPAAGYRSTYNSNVTRVTFYRPDDFGSPFSFEPEFAKINPGGDNVITVEKGKWCIRTSVMAPKYFASASLRQTLVFNNRRDMLIYDDSSLRYYNKDGVLYNSVKCNFVNYYVTDLYDSLVLLTKSNLSFSTQIDEDGGDSLYLLDLSKAGGKPVFLTTVLSSQEVNLADKGRCLATRTVVTNSSKDVQIQYQVISLNDRKKQLIFIMYPGTSDNIIINQDYNPIIPSTYSGGRFSVGSGGFGSIVNFNSGGFLSSLRYHKIRLYDARNPKVRFADQPDSIIAWAKRTPSNIPGEQHKIELYLDSQKWLDWLPF